MLHNLYIKKERMNLLLELIFPHRYLSHSHGNETLVSPSSWLWKSQAMSLYGFFLKIYLYVLIFGCLWSSLWCPPGIFAMARVLLASCDSWAAEKSVCGSENPVYRERSLRVLQLEKACTLHQRPSVAKKATIITEGAEAQHDGKRGRSCEVRGRHCNFAATSRSMPGATEAGRGKERLPSKGAWPCWHLGQTSGLPNYERIDRMLLHSCNRMFCYKNPRNDSIHHAPPLPTPLRGVLCLTF